MMYLSRRDKRENSNFTEGAGGEYRSESWEAGREGSLGRGWDGKCSGREVDEAFGVVLVVGRASTTSRAAELDIVVVRVGEREGKGKGLDDWLRIHCGFVCVLIVSSLNPLLCAILMC